MPDQKLPHVQIYSDGGANPNPGPGGYGVILECGGVIKELSQGYKQTTNNRMELRGAIEGLQQLKKKSRVTLSTDSQYTINGIEKGWAVNWKKAGWKRSGNKPVINSDLWEIFLNLVSKHEVNFQWVKGHNGHPQNERCDTLATEAIELGDHISDEGFDEATITNSTPSQTSLTSSGGDVTAHSCRKCGDLLLKKIPKHSKKTLEKKYYYAYYYHCPGCGANFMPEEAKRDITTLKL